MRAPASTAAVIVSTASRMSPSANGSCPGSAPSRNRRASAASQYPRRTSTPAVTSSSPSSAARARISAYAQGSSCQVPVAMGAGHGTERVGQIHPKSPGTCLNSAPVLRTLGSLAIAAGLAAAATPAATPTRVVPAGVSVGGIAVGGLSAEPARARIDAAFAQPVRILAAGKLLRVGPAQVGAASSVDDAVSSALDATPRSKIALPVRYSTKKIEKLVAHLAHLYDRPAVDATVTGATGSAPTFAPAKPGRAVDQRTMRAAIVGLLRDGTRTPLQLMMQP